MKKLFVFLLHLVYWCLYLDLIYFFFRLTNERARPPFLEALFFPQLLLTVLLPSIICYYSFYGILFKQFLKKKKFGQLILFALAVITGTALLSLMVLRLTAPKYILKDTEAAIAGTLFIAIIGLVHGIIALVMKGFISWYGDIKIKEELNRQNLDMQLELIKSQINPHFLFNTINNIDVLIQKEPVSASLYLNKLSDIMRFFLYETNSGKISFGKERAYIEKYLELQKIRHSNPESIHYSVKGDGDSVFIEPMLFIPFIENAFKHASFQKEGTAIDINFVIEQDVISFNCENRYHHSSARLKEDKGLGNDLVVKRLSLLYPDKHSLKINDTGNNYGVQLKIHHAN